MHMYLHTTSPQKSYTSLILHHPILILLSLHVAIDCKLISYCKQTMNIRLCCADRFVMACTYLSFFPQWSKLLCKKACYTLAYNMFTGTLYTRVYSVPTHVTHSLSLLNASV